MQNSARCVLPETSVRRLRKMRSTSHGVRPPNSTGFGEFAERDLEFVERVVAGFVDAGACEVGPMNRPENR
jgi:hypothetical protein